MPIRRKGNVNTACRMSVLMAKVDLYNESSIYRTKIDPQLIDHTKPAVPRQTKVERRPEDDENQGEGEGGRGESGTSKNHQKWAHSR
jgi:hypothetical protein